MTSQRPHHSSVQLVLSLFPLYRETSMERLNHSLQATQLVRSKSQDLNPDDLARECVLLPNLFPSIWVISPGPRGALLCLPPRVAMGDAWTLGVHVLSVKRAEQAKGWSPAFLHPHTGFFL